ncbi:P-loop containing nucleoside triphosphate hydrolase protein [Fistulina hepatica ATCC 64428]|uniref:RNA helicase n=1 Tax=Fistulina hepatica ATCC 64428 TaxID=1128425 RepID=A0A0D7AJ28_9AGAR|nr:P-loop containing nucleoside triphosphate hydrolase protein [Fistulina hepatica ATCC 64428]
MGLNNPILRKRGSVAGLARRDSVGVIDPHAAEYGGSREAGPIISKWDQLAISPELLRSLNKFGVGPPNKIQQRALPFLLRGADIIAQAPPTQERIAAYVIPAIQIAVTTPPAPTKWPLAILISTTVDQATQAQRMIRDLGGPIGIRSALGVGTVSLGSDIAGELRGLQQTRPHIVCGTPQKLHALFTSSGGLPGSEVRFLVLDEVDQLIARNLHDFVYNLVKVLPPSRSRPLSSAPATSTPASAQNTGTSSSLFSPSPFDPAVLPPVPGHSSPPTTSDAVSIASEGSKASEGGASTPAVERQTALFSNTVPQDVLNLASNLHLLEPVRVLVRRDGNVTHADANQGSRGLRQFYLYLAFQAGGGRASSTPSNGLGIIGSGRASVAASAETTQAREWKLEALLDIFEDVDVSQAVVHVGGMTNLDAVVHKLALRGIEGIPMHGDMAPPNKIAALTKFRTNTSLTRSHSGFMVAPHAGAPLMRPPPQMKVLVVYDVQVKAQEVSHIPLIINYDLPKAVEEYAHRVAPAVAPNYARAGVVVNFVTASGGDVEMLRSIECFYKIKCPEVPMSLREIV